MVKHQQVIVASTLDRLRVIAHRCRVAADLCLRKHHTELHRCRSFSGPGLVLQSAHSLPRSAPNRMRYDSAMNAQHVPDYESVLNRVREWPAADRFALI